MLITQRGNKANMQNILNTPKALSVWHSPMIPISRNLFPPIQ